MSEETGTAAPQGKGLAIGGFVLSLVGLIFSSWVAALTVVNMTESLNETGEIGGKGLMYFWMVLCIASVVLSVMGMSKLGKTGGKKGLAIAGLVIGIVAVLYALLLLAGLETAAEIGNNSIDELRNLQNR